MSGMPPRRTARGAYFFEDVDMAHEYKCHKCGKTSIPYMLLIKERFCLTFCSFNCAMVVEMSTNMQPRRDMAFQGVKGKPQLRLVKR